MKHTIKLQITDLVSHSNINLNYHCSLMNPNEIFWHEGFDTRDAPSIPETVLNHYNKLFYVNNKVWIYREDGCYITYFCQSESIYIKVKIISPRYFCKDNYPDLKSNIADIVK